VESKMEFRLILIPYGKETVRGSKRYAQGSCEDAQYTHVAALAKVSIATVSRTINGSSAVRERLSKRVWQAIEQLNYFPNSHARALVSGRSRLFGIIVEILPTPSSPN